MSSNTLLDKSSIVVIQQHLDYIICQGPIVAMVSTFVCGKEGLTGAKNCVIIEGFSGASVSVRGLVAVVAPCGVC